MGYIMSAPNVYFAWNKRIASCAYGCGKDILVKEPVVIVFFWRRGGDDHAKFNIKKYYHPQCWIAQGMDYLGTHPYQAEGERGPKITLSQADHRKRFLLLRRKGALEQRRRNVKCQDAQRALVLARLDAAIAACMLEIAEVGGIPKRWIEQMLVGEHDA